jgi:hypothetical protein
MSRAGYIPQLFSLCLSNPAVIFELLCKANAKALVYDGSFAPVLANCPIPTHLAVDVGDVGDMGEPLPEMPTAAHCDQIVLIMHTSGSTSGSPKLIPCSAAWLDAIVNKAYQVGRPRDFAMQDVCVWM